MLQERKARGGPYAPLCGLDGQAVHSVHRQALPCRLRPLHSLLQWHPHHCLSASDAAAADFKAIATGEGSRILASPPVLPQTLHYIALPAMCYAEIAALLYSSDLWSLVSRQNGCAFLHFPRIPACRGPPGLPGGLVHTLVLLCFLTRLEGPKSNQALRRWCETIRER